METLEKVLKIAGGAVVFGILAKMYLSYQAGQRAKGDLKLRKLKDEIGDATKDLSNANMREFLKRANERWSKLRSNDSSKGDS